MSDYFDMVCTCCDKTQIDMQIMPKLSRRKNQDAFHTLYNRPKYVDPQILIQFLQVLNGSKGALSNANVNASESLASTHLAETRSLLLRNLERVFNHVEFARKLDAHTLTSVDMLDSNLISAPTAASGTSSNNTNATNLTYLFRETMNLLADDTLDSIIRCNK